MRIVPRVLAAVALLATTLAPTALAGGGPVDRSVYDYDDPAWEAGESAWASDLCGFEVAVDAAGHNIFTAFPEDQRTVLALDHYAARIDYTNVATGVTVRLRDIGPDRYFVRDGRWYVAVTGRSTFSNRIGVVVFDLETMDIVRDAGRSWDFYGTLCEQLAPAT